MATGAPERRAAGGLRAVGVVGVGVGLLLALLNASLLLLALGTAPKGAASPANAAPTTAAVTAAAAAAPTTLATLARAQAGHGASFAPQWRRWSPARGGADPRAASPSNDAVPSSASAPKPLKALHHLVG
eukprot:4774910-Prymnesium_polylepis.1